MSVELEPEVTAAVTDAESLAESDAESLAESVLDADESVTESALEADESVSDADESALETDESVLEEAFEESDRSAAKTTAEKTAVARTRLSFMVRKVGDDRTQRCAGPRCYIVRRRRWCRILTVIYEAHMPDSLTALTCR